MILLFITGMPVKDECFANIGCEAYGKIQGFASFS